MVSISSKRRGYVTVLLSLISPLLPSLMFPLISPFAVSLWPALTQSLTFTNPFISNTTVLNLKHTMIQASPVARAPKVPKLPTYTQNSTYTPPVTTAPSSQTSNTTQYPGKSLSATSKTLTSPSAKTFKTSWPKTSLRNLRKTSLTDILDMSTTATSKTPPASLDNPASLHLRPVSYQTFKPPVGPLKHPHPPPSPKQQPRALPKTIPVQKRPTKLPPLPSTLLTPSRESSFSPPLQVPPSPPPPPPPPPPFKTDPLQSARPARKHLPLIHTPTPSLLSSVSVLFSPTSSSPPPPTAVRLHTTVSPWHPKPCSKHHFPVCKTIPFLSSPNSSSLASPQFKTLQPPPVPKGASPHPGRPPKPTHKPPSPVPTAFLSSTPKTSPAPPLPKPSPSTIKTTCSRHPRPTPLLPQTARPLFDGQPFIVSWNVPDLVCNRYNISLDTSPFRGVATPAKVPGQFLSMFYTDRLGFYPHVDQEGSRQLYGGIPQRGNLKASLAKAQADINYYIPSRMSRGLAVIDWEEWRPLWDRNWGTKRIYQTLSVAYAMQRDHSLTAQRATAKAKQQFQLAARSVMSTILNLGTAMRPNYLWGFYLFPNCYNYGWLEPGYTGRCSEEVRGQNDELIWMWEASTALYPSVYLQASLGDNPNAALMVRHRVQEALRVSKLPRRTHTAPVFVYTRPVFIDRNRQFLSEADLVSTVGESAAVGASGAVMWGASADYGDKASCEALSSYLSTTLNPYITNITVAAQLCSNFLCRGSGRCVRKDPDSNHYLHLSPRSFRIVHVHDRYLVLGRPSFKDLKVFSRRFTCQCYEGMTCTPRRYRELVKVLMLRGKQRLHKKVQTVNKAILDQMQQASVSKETVEKNP